MVSYILHFAIIGGIIAALVISMTPPWFSSLSLSIGLSIFAFVVLHKRNKQKAMALRVQAHDELRKLGELHSLPTLSDEVLRCLITFSDELAEIDQRAKKWNVLWSEITWEFQTTAQAIRYDAYRLENKSKEYVLACREGPILKTELEGTFERISGLIEKTPRHAARARYWDAREMFDQALGLGDESCDIVRRYHFFVAVGGKLAEAEEVLGAILEKSGYIKTI